MFGTKFIAPVLAAASLAICGVARADPDLGPDTDIVGLKLTMTGLQAREFIRSHYGNVSIAEMKAGLATNYWHKDTVIGFYFEVTPKGSPYSTERVKILTDPNGLDRPIFAISRYKIYRTGEQPTFRATFDSLTGKYGNQIYAGYSSKTLDAAPYFTWIKDRNFADRSTYTGCNRSFSASADVLYEQSGLLDDDYRGASYAAGSSDSDFVSYVNNISGQHFDYTSCGLMLQARVFRAQNQDYVAGISERIVDLRKANRALKEFGDKFWVEEHAARQAKVNQDSRNKPAL